LFREEARGRGKNGAAPVAGNGAVVKWFMKGKAVQVAGICEWSKRQSEDTAIGHQIRKYSLPEPCGQNHYSTVEAFPVQS